MNLAPTRSISETETFPSLHCIFSTTTTCNKENKNPTSSSYQPNTNPPSISQQSSNSTRGEYISALNKERIVPLKPEVEEINIPYGWSVYRRAKHGAIVHKDNPVQTVQVEESIHEQISKGMQVLVDRWEKYREEHKDDIYYDYLDSPESDSYDEGEDDLYDDFYDDTGDPLGYD